MPLPRGSWPGPLLFPPGLFFSLHKVLQPIDPKHAYMVARMLAFPRSDDLESKLLDLLYERNAGEAAVCFAEAVDAVRASS